MRRHRTQSVSGTRKPTPSPPTNPPEPRYTHSDHDIHPEGAVYDHDGPSRKQQERMGSPICNVVIEMNPCGRDGCDAAVKKNHLYTVDSMSDELEAAVRYAADVERWGEDALGEYVAQHVTIVDYDEVPVLTVEFGESTFGYWYPETTDDRGDARGECHGRVDEATRLGI